MGSTVTDNVAGVRFVFDEILSQLGLAVTSSRVLLPNCPIEIVQAVDDDEGLLEVKLRVANVDTTRDWFLRRGIELDDRSGVPVERSLGAQLVFVA